jgi:hypothetical protein
MVATILAAAFLAAPAAATAQSLKNPIHLHPPITASAESGIRFIVHNTDSVEHWVKINGEPYRFAPNMQRSILAPVGTHLESATVMRSYSAGKYSAGETIHNVTVEDQSKAFDFD